MHIPGMKTAVLSTAEGFELLKQEWNDLLHKSSSNVVCLTHEWLSAWWQTFSGSRSLHIVTVRDSSGTLLAIAPMAIIKAPYRGITIRKISFLANGHSPCADFIVHKDRRQEGLAAIFGHLSRYDSWDLVELQTVAEDSETLSFMQNAAKKAGIPAGVQESLETPFIPISSTWDEFLGGRSAKFRKVLRNKINRAERTGSHCACAASSMPAACRRPRTPWPASWPGATTS